MNSSTPFTPSPRRHRLNACALPAVWLLTALGLGGCAGGIEYAAVGAAATAAQTGETVIKRGKINAAQIATIDDVVAAIREACGELGLEITLDQRKKPQDHRITAEDEKGSDHKFRVRRRTDRLTHYQIDVGWFGSNATAKLLLNRVQVRLADNIPEGVLIVNPDPSLSGTD